MLNGQVDRESRLHQSDTDFALHIIDWMEMEMEMGKRCQSIMQIDFTACAQLLGSTTIPSIK